MCGKKKKMDNEIKEAMKQEYEELPLSLQIMHELRMSSQRWFIIAIAELIVILVILLFVFVIPQEEYSSITQELQDVYETSVTQTVGE